MDSDDNFFITIHFFNFLYKIQVTNVKRKEDVDFGFFKIGWQVYLFRC